MKYKLNLQNFANKNGKLKDTDGNTLYPQTKVSLLLNDNETPYKPPKDYTLPQATQTQLGGVKVAPATTEQTENVGIDRNGQLKVAPSGGGAGGGTPIGDGYNFSCSGALSVCDILVLGVMVSGHYGTSGSYGWHYAMAEDWDSEFTNVSLIVPINTRKIPRVTGEIYGYDGVKITNDNIKSYEGKLLYLKSDARITTED